MLKKLKKDHKSCIFFLNNRDEKVCKREFLLKYTIFVSIIFWLQPVKQKH